MRSYRPARTLCVVFACLVSLGAVPRRSDAADLLTVRDMEARFTSFLEVGAIWIVGGSRPNRGLWKNGVTPRASAVSILLFSGDSDRESGALLKSSQRVSTYDVDLVDKVQKGLSRGRLRTPRQADPVPMSDVIGVIELNIDGQAVQILMARTFVLRIDGQYTENGAFVSLELAETVNDILESNGRPTLTTEQMDNLSGVTARRAEEQAYSDDEFSQRDQIRSLGRKGRFLGVGAPDSAFFESEVLELSSKGPAESTAWAKLDFLMRNPPTGMRFRLTTQVNKAPVFDRKSIYVGDELTLRRAHRGIRESWKSFPCRGIYVGMAPNVAIEFYSAGRTVRVFINDRYFFIQNGCETSMMFRSWTLAKVLNDVMLKNTGKGMSRLEFAALAGPREAERAALGKK